MIQLSLRGDRHADAGGNPRLPVVGTKAWMPTCVGMTGKFRRRVDLDAGWYNSPGGTPV